MIIIVLSNFYLITFLSQSTTVMLVRTHNLYQLSCWHQYSEGLKAPQVLEFWQRHCTQYLYNWSIRTQTNKKSATNYFEVVFGRPPIYREAFDLNCLVVPWDEQNGILTSDVEWFRGRLPWGSVSHIPSLCKVHKTTKVKKTTIPLAVRHPERIIYKITLDMSVKRQVVPEKSSSVCASVKIYCLQ